MRRRNVRPFFFWLALAVITGLLAGLALASVALPELAPTPSPRPATIAPATTAPAPPVLSSARGFVALASSDAAASLRRETDAEPIASLRGRGFAGAVSGTGRRVAYWVSGTSATELRVFDVTAPDQDTLIATLPEAERGVAMVWSIDRTALLVTVADNAAAGFSALRTVDTPTRSVYEIARLTDGTRFWPVAWDRDAQLTASVVADAAGNAVAYAMVGEDARTERIAMESGIPAATVESSGAAILAVVRGAVIRVWSVRSYDEHRELGANPGERILAARWRPGGTEIVVAVADRLEVWPAAGGDHRVVARGIPAADDLLVSSEGAIAVVATDSGRSAIAIDLATGARAPVPMAGERLLWAVAFR